jgi:hypothetical protein
MKARRKAGFDHLAMRRGRSGDDDRVDIAVADEPSIVRVGSR